MMSIAEPKEIKGKGFLPTLTILPKEDQKVKIYTETRGEFVGSRHGHDWRVGVQCADDFSWIAFAIKDNDWWKYTD